MCMLVLSYFLRRRFLSATLRPSELRTSKSDASSDESSVSFDVLDFLVREAQITPRTRESVRVATAYSGMCDLMCMTCDVARRRDINDCWRDFEWCDACAALSCVSKLSTMKLLFPALTAADHWDHAIGICLSRRSACLSPGTPRTCVRPPNFGVRPPRPARTEN